MELNDITKDTEKLHFSYGFFIQKLHFSYAVNQF